MTCSPQAALDKIAKMVMVEQYVTTHPDSSSAEICVGLGLSQRALSRHIKELHELDRITCRPNQARGSGATPMRYRITPGQPPIEVGAQALPAAPASKATARQEARPARDPLVAALFGAAPCRPVAALVDEVLELIVPVEQLGAM